PTGANEHTFEPTQKDMMQLADSDLFFFIGLGLEGFIEKAESTLANANVKFIATSNAISEEHLHSSTGHSFEELTDHEHEDDAHSEHHHDHDDHNHGDIDPHVWLSPVLSQELALALKNELVKTMPEQEATFTKNYETLK